MNLFISLYPESNSARYNELIECLSKNMAHPYIDQVYVLNEGLDLKHLYLMANHKEEQIMIHGRPTYNDYFNYINSVTGKNDINIIANSDIYFDDTLALAEQIKTRECYAICRQEMPQNYWGSSQDVWIFRGRIGVVDGNFPIGVPGCDNRIAHMIFKAAYIVKNPCLSIKCWHKHKPQKKNWYHSDLDSIDYQKYDGSVVYNSGRKMPVVQKPYRVIIPCEL